MTQRELGDFTVISFQSQRSYVLIVKINTLLIWNNDDISSLGASQSMDVFADIYKYKCTGCMLFCAQPQSNVTVSLAKTYLPLA